MGRCRARHASKLVSRTCAVSSNEYSSGRGVRSLLPSGSALSPLSSAGSAAPGGGTLAAESCRRRWSPGGGEAPSVTGEESEVTPWEVGVFAEVAVGVDDDVDGDGSDAEAGATGFGDVIAAAVGTGDGGDARSADA